MYKSLGLLFIFFAATQAAFTQEGITALSKICNGSEEDVKVVRQFLVPNTPSGKCLMLCYLKSLNMLSNNGAYDYDKSLTALRQYWSENPDQDLQDVNNVCSTQAKISNVRPTDCEYGYVVMKCINAEFYKKRLLKNDPPH